MEINIVPSWGSRAAYIAVVGQSPGKEEFVQQKPFVGPSGKIIREWLKQSNIYPDLCFWSNITDRVLLGSDAPTKEDIEIGKERLKKELFALPNLRYVILVGTFASGLLFYGPMRGRIGKEGSLFGVFPCTAIWHPAYYLRSANKERQSKIKEDVINTLTNFIKPSVFDRILSRR